MGYGTGMRLQQISFLLFSPHNFLKHMEQLKAYLETQKGEYLNELLDLLRIPSISADDKYTPDVKRAAEFVKTQLQKAGAEKVEICPTKGHPIVYGEKIIDPK